MKSHTDLPQSKKLAEFLPIKSADAYYTVIDQGFFLEVKQGIEPSKDDIPCWSLTALLGVLPIVYTNDKKEICGPLHIDITDSENPFALWYVNPLHKGSIVELKTKEYDNLVDACVAMIEKLHKQNLI